MGNPAELSGLSSLVRTVMDTVRDLVSRVGRLERERAVYFERAQVTAYTGGSTQCTVTYPSGAPRTLPYLSPYVPVVNDQVLVVNSPAWSGVVGKVSV